MSEQEENEKFTVQLSQIASKYPGLKIDTYLVNNEGDILLSIPHDDLEILDADRISKKGE